MTGWTPGERGRRRNWSRVHLASDVLQSTISRRHHNVLLLLLTKPLPTRSPGFLEARCNKHAKRAPLSCDHRCAAIVLTGEEKPIIVAWSIGGVILDEYLSAYGDDGIAGAVYLGAGHTLGEHANPYLGAGFVQYAQGIMSPDLATNIAATIGVSMENTAQPMPPEMLTAAVATAMVVPLEARVGLVSRSVNHIADTLPNVTVPLRFLHGTADRIVNPASSVDAAAAAPNAELIEIEGIGHVPALEAPATVIEAILDIAKITQ